MHEFYEKGVICHTFEKQAYSRFFITNRDLLGKAYSANKILNLYFQKTGIGLRMLPENSLDPETKGMSRIAYFYYVNEVLYHNSKLLKFDYPLYVKHLSFAVNTKEKVYGPIIEYLKIKENINQN